jgi:hypothetical protein
MMEEGSSSVEKVVVEGFSQQEAIDLDESLTLVVEGFF